LGTYEILPQVEDKLLKEAWELHKKIVGAYPRKGMGLEMTIDFRRLDTVRVSYVIIGSENANNDP
jgi:hypothetical protein